MPLLPFNHPSNPPAGSEGNVAAVVQIGNVQPDSQDAKYVQSNSNVPTIWTDYKIRNHYEGDGHKYMLGITSPNGFEDQSVAFVQLASKTLLWICDWTACRTGVRPLVPDPNPTDTNWVLLDDYWEPAGITIGGDGKTPIYRISGTYVYGHRKPSKATIDNIAFGCPPWLEDAFPRNVTSTQLQQGISTPVRSLTGGAVPG